MNSRRKSTIGNPRVTVQDMSDDDGPMCTGPLSAYELQRLETMRINKIKLDEIDREQALKLRKRKGSQDVCEVKIEIGDDYDDYENVRHAIKRPIKKAYQHATARPPVKSIPRTKRASRYNGGFNYSFDSDVPTSVITTDVTVIPVPPYVLPKKRRTDDYDYKVDHYSSEVEVVEHSKQRGEIKRENAMIKEERIERTKFVKAAKPSALSPLHTISGFNIQYDGLTTYPLLYKVGKFRRRPELENINVFSDVSADMLSFFSTMIVDTSPEHILVFKKVLNRCTAIGRFFQFDTDEAINLVQSFDGTVLLTDATFSFVGSSKITRRCIFEDRLFLESTDYIDTICVNENYRFHYNQIYDRIIQPKEVDGSAATIRAYNTKATNCLVPIVVDAKGREIISAFREKEFLTPLLHIHGLRLEHARTLDRMTEDGCHLRFELVQGNVCIAYKMFPVKMCNSLHALKDADARLQRGGSSMLGLDFHSLEEEWKYLTYK